MMQMRLWAEAHACLIDESASNNLQCHGLLFVGGVRLPTVMHGRHYEHQCRFDAESVKRNQVSYVEQLI